MRLVNVAQKVPLIMVRNYLGQFIGLPEAFGRQAFWLM
jgi:hypothetical protein